MGGETGSKRRILTMDRPRFWGAPKMQMMEKLLPEIRAAAPDFEVHYLEEQAELEADDEATRTRLTRNAIPGAEVVVAFDLAPAALAQADSLKWLHILSAGVEHTLYPELIDSPVVVTAAKGSGGIPMAEWAMMQMLLWNKNMLHYLDAQRRQTWDPADNGELNNMTVGIIGLGFSGADLARKCQAFHMRVLGLRRTDAPCPDVDEMFTRDRLHDFLARADFVVVTTPVTPGTRGLLGEAEFRAMKPTAYFVVTSRGGVAQDEALLRALNEGWIAGASLDAHTVEPLPPDSLFWTAPNAITTPHAASSGPGGLGRLEEIFLDNLRRYVRGQPLRATVDKQGGY